MLQTISHRSAKQIMVSARPGELGLLSAGVVQAKKEESWCELKIGPARHNHPVTPTNSPKLKANLVHHKNQPLLAL